MPNKILATLGSHLKGKDGDVPISSLEGKNIAIYFSAHWCPPCKAFTPKLAATYNELKKSGRTDFEFIFVSSDRNEEAFNEYFGEMPWLALPFDKRAEKDSLSRLWTVQGIPTLITIDSEGNTINRTARASATEDPTGKDFPWRPKPMAELSESVEANGFDINDKPALIVFCETADDLEQKEISETLLEIAESEAEAAKRESRDPKIIFFTVKSSEGVVPQVKRGLDISEGPLAIILNLQDDGACFVGPTSITKASLSTFVNDFFDEEKKKALERKQFKSRR